MKSYELTFPPRSFAGAVLPTAVLLIVLLALLKLAAVCDWLPPEAAGMSPEKVIFANKARLAKSRHPAEVVLTGDSTCMLGVDASALPDYLPGSPRAINLALIISYGFDVYGHLISEFDAANPNQVRMVVLLVSATKVSDGGANDIGVEDWLAQQRQSDPDPLALDALRTRVFGHVLATPLRGRGAELLGFYSEVDGYMTARDGTLAEFDTFNPRRDRVSEWTWDLSPEIERASREFRARLPEGVVLCIGMMPGPASTIRGLEKERSRLNEAGTIESAEGPPPHVGGYAAPGNPAPDVGGYAEAKVQRDRLLLEWNEWVGADVVLTNLPVALPDVMFSRTAHLNVRGQEVFTKMLGRELAGVWERM